MRTVYGLAIAGAVLATVGAAQGAFLSNTGFELVTGGTVFTGWSEGNAASATSAPVAISGDSSAKLAYANAGSLYQTASDPGAELTQWVFEVDFAANDPGSSSARSFNLNLRHTTSGFNQINIRVVQGSSAGTLQLYSAGGFNLSIADSVTFSESDTELQVNHLRVVGDYTASPTYSVYITDASNVTRSLTDLSSFQGNAPAAGDRLRMVSFETGNYPTSGAAWSVVDNVSLAVVPEPALLGVAGLGCLLAMRRRQA